MTVSWELVAGLLGLQLAAEPVRYLVRSCRSQARQLRENHRGVRARYRAHSLEARGRRDAVYRMARITWRRALRSLRWQQWARLVVAAGLWAVLFATWFALHIVVADQTLSADLDRFPVQAYTEPKLVLCVVAVLLVLMLAGLMTRDGEWAPRPRALIYVMVCCAFALFLDEYGKDSTADPDQVALALVSLSPAAWQVISRLLLPAALRPAGVRDRVWDLVIPDLTWPPPPSGAVQTPPSTSRPLQPKKPTPKRVQPPPITPAPPLPVVSLDQIELDDVISSLYQHISRARVRDRAGQFAFKRFGADGNNPNPIRPLQPYLERISRINRLAQPDRVLAQRVLVWPVAVVEEGGMAAGVIMEELGKSFLLDHGEVSHPSELGTLQDPNPVRTGDYLFEEDLGFTEELRARVLLDIVVAHGLMHRMSLAHGDTSLWNVALALPPQAAGIVFDTDGATDFHDPAPRLIGQPLWELPADIVDPEIRDLARLALLVARVAARQLDANDLPLGGPRWLTPELRAMVRRSLHDPSRSSSAAELVREISRGLKMSSPLT